MPLATPSFTFGKTADCVNCGGKVKLDQPDPDRPGVWVHVYAPEWGRLMICDPEKVREASKNDR